ncbi:TRAP transporter small permease [Phaeovulum sp. W22_SRMD_FR3]|uniref:TRAP transporter small permease n=1 Tax=Phaeovulum sp. W22_SRMD_FR3 TaxID=3240274 RepID=UPI003F9B1FFA
MKIPKAIDRALMRLELIVALAAMTGVVLLLSAQVFCRYLLQSPLFFAEEVALLLLIIATFIGLSLLVAEDKLIGIDLLGSIMSPRGHAWVAWAMRAAVALLAGSLAFYALRYVSTPWVWNERFATVPLPRAGLYAIVAFELCVMVFHQLMRLCDSFPPARREDIR